MEHLRAHRSSSVESLPSLASKCFVWRRAAHRGRWWRLRRRRWWRRLSRPSSSRAAPPLRAGRVWRDASRTATGRHILLAKHRLVRDVVVIVVLLSAHLWRAVSQRGRRIGSTNSSSSSSRSSLVVVNIGVEILKCGLATFFSSESERIDNFIRMVEANTTSL